MASHQYILASHYLVYQTVMTFLNRDIRHKECRTKFQMSGHLRCDVGIREITRVIAM